MSRHNRALDMLQALDPFTSDTLKSMLRYVPDDRRIASHLGIAPEIVRRARTRVPQNAGGRAA
jgi:hypothetical protein